MESTALAPGLQLQDGQYQLQNQQLLAMCEKYGTPLYLYDGNRIRHQYKQMHSAFGKLNGKIKYAAKSLTNINVLKLLCQLGSGLDTVSLQEVRLGLLAGFDPKDIIYTPNCVSFEELQAAVELGVVINIDNISIL